MNRLLLTVAALASVAATSPATAATNLLVNGSFENGLAGWTVGGTGAQAPSVIDYGTFGQSITAPTVFSPSPDAAGTHGLYFYTDNAAPQTLTQIVNITRAGVYNFGFDLFVPANGQANANDATMQVIVNGATTPLVTASTTQTGSWSHVQSTGSLQLGPGTFALTFRSNGTPAKDFVVDRAYLTAAVPEPATWAMMIAGFGMVGAGMRRRSGSRQHVAA